MRPMLLAMLWCLPSLAVAQVGETTSTEYQISGLGTITKVGDVLLSSVSPTVTSKPVGVVNVNATDVEISVSDVNRLPYQPLKLDADSWMIDKPGKWWVEVKEYGKIELADGSTRRIVLDSTVVVVESVLLPVFVDRGPDLECHAFWLVFFIVFPIDRFHVLIVFHVLFIFFFHSH